MAVFYRRMVNYHFLFFYICRFISLSYSDSWTAWRAGGFDSQCLWSQYAFEQLLLLLMLLLFWLLFGEFRRWSGDNFFTTSYCQFVFHTVFFLLLISFYPFWVVKCWLNLIQWLFYSCLNSPRVSRFYSFLKWKRLYWKSCGMQISHENKDWTLKGMKKLKDKVRKKRSKRMQKCRKERGEIRNWWIKYKADTLSFKNHVGLTD